MAITFVASAQANVTTTTSLAISKPTGVADGDLMIAYMISQVNTAGESWTGDTGWTELVDEGTMPSARIAYKIAASEGASYTFTAATSQNLSGGILAYRGAAYDTIGAFHEVGAVAGNMVAPSISVAQSSSILLGLFGCRGASNTFTTPTGMTSRASDSNTTSPSWNIFEQSVSSGATGTRTSTCSANTARSSILLSLKPTASAVTGTGSVTESADTASASGKVTRTGTAAITESADTPSASGKVTRTGTGSVTEAADTPSAAGSVRKVGTGSVTESGDTASGIATTPTTGTGAATEAGDTPEGSGQALFNIARPDADTSTGGWHPSSGAQLFAMVDEAEADDADYVYANTSTTCEMALRSSRDPRTSSGQVMKYRVWSPSGDGITVTLKEGPTTIASWTHPVLPTTPTTYEQTLSAAECDAISDYTALSVVMESI